MKIVSAIQTWNNIKYERTEGLYLTHSSLEPQCDETLLFDNHSHDGTLDIVHSLGGKLLKGSDGSWPAAVLLKVEAALAVGADVVICSDDDVQWHPTAVTKLRRFWGAAPDNLVLISGFLEPQWPWNTIKGMIGAGGERALIRESAPGGGWCFRATAWPILREVIEKKKRDMQCCDYQVCCNLVQRGYRLGQMDLGKHLGYEKTTWGNSPEVGDPVDLYKWGLVDVLGQ